MLVVRRLVALAALMAPLLVPALVGGSDTPHALRAGSKAPVAAPFGTYDTELPVSETLTFASPGHGPHVAFHAATEPRKLLLSFDDGPDLRGTPLILDELDRRGLKAIFFVTGWRLKGERPEDIARRDLVRKIAAHGHLVANHTMTTTTSARTRPSRPRRSTPTPSSSPRRPACDRCSSARRTAPSATAWRRR